MTVAINKVLNFAARALGYWSGLVDSWLASGGLLLGCGVLAQGFVVVVG